MSADASTAMGRSWRRLRRLLRPHAGVVVYHPRYALAVSGLPMDPLRAERTLAFLASEAVVGRGHVRTPRPASLKSLARVHEDDYLESIHAPETLGRIFGATIPVDPVDRLLDHQRLLVGGTKLAAHLALAHRGLAINLGGGLHHAHGDRGEGFCIWNDVAVAIEEVRSRGFDGRVLVVDLDLHDGNGTRAIFAEDERVHTFSIHARHWGSTEAVASTAIALGDAIDDSRYLDALRTSLPPLVSSFRPDLVFYLAGTDVAHDDRLGNWQLSPRAVLARDHLVLALFRRRGRAGGHRAPLVITPAGGYGADAWRYQARFLSLALGGRAIEPPSTEVMTLKRFRHLSRLLDPAALSGGGGDNFGITEEDLALPGWGQVRDTRLLGYYTKHGVELVLEQAGLLDRLRDLGYSHPSLDFETDESDGHGLRVWGDPEHRELLVDIRLDRDRRTVPSLSLLSIEWLQMQNPRADFGIGSEALPGQRSPGLGMAHEAVALCVAAAERLHMDGVVWTPAYFHTGAPWLDVVTPTDVEAGATIRALRTLLAGHSFEETARAVHEQRVVERATNAPVSWKPVPLVLPLSEAAKQWAAEQEAAIDHRPLLELVWVDSPSP